MHDPDNEEDREHSLETMLSVLDLTRIDQNRWYLDVAMQYGLPGHVVTWKSRTHHRILRHVFPDEDAHALTEKSTFMEDHLMHLQEVSGFRADSSRWGDQTVSYIQAYTTDKSPFYQLHQGKYRMRRPAELLESKSLGTLIDDLAETSNVLIQCSGTQGMDPQNGCARIEVRIPLSMATTDKVRLPERLLQRCLYAVPSWQWW
jgi:hypothetical protein